MATLPSTLQTTVYPDIEYDSESAFLQPLVVTICFSGPVPKNLIRSNIPIEISVSMAEEYNKVMAPVVRTKAWSAYQSEPSASSYSHDQLSFISHAKRQQEGSDSSDGISHSFLPLPRTFDPKDSQHWVDLSREIEQWLVNEVKTTASPVWQWGLDIFWMTFIAAYPMFPHGNWYSWNPSIPLGGQFIEEWMNGDRESVSSAGAETELEDDATERTPMLLWDLFCKHVALFYPYSLFDTR